MAGLTFLNIDLVKEWADDLKEYWGDVLKPFKSISLGQVVGCKGNPVEAFQALTVCWFWTYAAYLISYNGLLVYTLGSHSVDTLDMVIEILWACLIAFLNCSLQWFSVCKKYGCCWCILCCYEDTLVLLIVGIFNLMYGVLNTLHALQATGIRTPNLPYYSFGALRFSVHDNSLFYIPALLLLLQCIIQAYMGATCLRIYNGNKGSRGVEFCESGSESESA